MGQEREAAICLITPSQLSSAPRVVKEAGALAARGHAVAVVSTLNHTDSQALDDEIAGGADWHSVRVDLRGRRRTAARLLRRLARHALAARPGSPWTWAAAAESDAYGPLRVAAGGIRARLYIGHCLTGLAVALGESGRRGAALGFDAEDYHEEELLPSQMGVAGVRAARILQAAAWPRCKHLTAAAPLIAQRLGLDYGREPEVVLNVFPRSMAPPPPEALRPANAPARFYWFSQTLGPGRGLEEVVEACAFLPRPVELCLRGHDEGGFGGWLGERLRRVGGRHLLSLLPLAPAGEMARLAAGFDAGLCLERTVPGNRGLCLTNKVFTYLLAGLPMVLSETPAHTALAPELGPAAVLARSGDARALARAMARLADDAAGGRAAARHAWALGHSRFHWESEQEKLVAGVERALGVG